MKQFEVTSYGALMRSVQEFFDARTDGSIYFGRGQVDAILSDLEADADAQGYGLDRAEIEIKLNGRTITLSASDLNGVRY